MCWMISLSLSLSSPLSTCIGEVWEFECHMLIQSCTFDHTYWNLPFSLSLHTLLDKFGRLSITCWYEALPLITFDYFFHISLTNPVKSHHSLSWVLHGECDFCGVIYHISLTYWDNNEISLPLSLPLSLCGFLFLFLSFPSLTLRGFLFCNLILSFLLSFPLPLYAWFSIFVSLSLPFSVDGFLFFLCIEISFYLSLPLSMNI